MPSHPPLPEPEHNAYTEANTAAFGIPEAEVLMASGALESDVLPPMVDMPVPAINTQRIVRHVFAKLGLTAGLVPEDGSLSTEEQDRLARLRERAAAISPADGLLPRERQRWDWLRWMVQSGRITEG